MKSPREWGHLPQAGPDPREGGPSLALPFRLLAKSDPRTCKKKSPNAPNSGEPEDETNGEVARGNRRGGGRDGTFDLKSPDQEMTFSRSQRSGCSTGNDTPIHTQVVYK